jgi:hypothetical protein
LLDESKDIRDDAREYPLGYPPSPMPPGWVHLIVFYKLDKNNGSTIY